jgi:ATP-dependent exoDNAse (exonuclease V) beta subunit
LYECIKGISEEIAPEVKSNKANRILDRGTAIDVMCRTIFGTAFNSLEEALAVCKTLKITSKFGTEVLVKDFFTNEAFESAITHLWNTKKVYVEDLGYTLWTAPFTIYTEDFNGVNGSINIAGEVDMLAIDKDGNIIIIDYKTSKNPFFLNGEESPSFKTASDNQTKSAKEQYTNQQSAYV